MADHRGLYLLATDGDASMYSVTVWLYLVGMSQECGWKWDAPRMRNREWLMVVGLIVASSVSRTLCAHTKHGETPIVLLHKAQEDQVLRRSEPLYLKTMDRQTWNGRRRQR